MKHTITTIWWRGIPAQVQGRAGRERYSVALPDRFQVAIDRAAMRAGLIGTDEYLSEWRRDARPCGDDVEAEVEAEARRLDADYSQARLARLIESGGDEEEVA